MHRGVSEAVSAMVLLTVIATVSYYALGNSSKNILDNQRSVAEVIDLKSAQTQELVSVISRNLYKETIALEMINFGTKPIVVERVFVDGTSSDLFTVFDSDGHVFSNNTLPIREIMTLQVTGTGKSLQIVTDSQNLINLPLT